jgi:hypothetical protein
VKSFYPVSDFFVEKILGKEGEKLLRGYQGESLSLPCSLHFARNTLGI